MLEEIKKIIVGEATNDEGTLKKYSHDASLFEIKPQTVIFPKNSVDVQNLVKFINSQRDSASGLRESAAPSLTARSGGTDMTGGPLTESIVLDFTKHFNRLETHDGEATAQPGVWYRDFEKETLKNGWLLPSYPASKEICAIGGMVSNNSGGEKTLKYEKTENYVESLKAVLSDGEEYELKKLTRAELDKKTADSGFIKEIYRRIFKLLDDNYDLIKNAKPKVSKNSAGYNIWNVWNKERQEFDLSKLIVGSQGTLGIITETTFRLVKAKSHSGLLVIFMKDLENLPEIVKSILPLQPVSFESFDDRTFKLAAKFFLGFRKTLGIKSLFSLALKFLPDLLLVLTGGVPKMILLAEFEGDSQEEVDHQIIAAKEKIKDFPVKIILANTEEKSKKYWVMRRESFNLLRHRVKGKRTAPFIDDLVVRPESLPDFLPKLYEILNRYQFEYTIAGHIGNGNVHIIPLMELKTEEEKEKIFQSMDEVYKLVLEYGGSFTGEHNDGIIRTPYLKMMYGEKIYSIFEEIKKIFDPKNIFNPGKKVGGDLAYAKNHIKLGL